MRIELSVAVCKLKFCEPHYLYRALTEHVIHQRQVCRFDAQKALRRAIAIVWQKKTSTFQL